MNQREFHEAVLRIVREDPRFGPDAYPFVVQALTLARRRGDGLHASAHELLESFRAQAWTSYGPQAGSVLRNWGLEPQNTRTTLNPGVAQLHPSAWSASSAVTRV